MKTKFLEIHRAPRISNILKRLHVSYLGQHQNISAFQDHGRFSLPSLEMTCRRLISAFIQQEHLSNRVILEALPEVDLSFLRNWDLKLYLEKACLR